MSNCHRSVSLSAVRSLTPVNQMRDSSGDCAIVAFRWFIAPVNDWCKAARVAAVF
jgi:hypothetical protein